MKTLPTSSDEYRDRDLKMFKMFLRGHPVEEIAKAFGVSPSLVYQIRKRDNWNQHKAKLDGRHMLRALDEVKSELSELDQYSNSNFKQASDGRWYYEVTVVTPKGVRRHGLFHNRPRADVEVGEINEATGERIIRCYVDPPRMFRSCD